jgi:hypothetical protein
MNGLRQTIEAACAEARCSAGDLTVLAVQNDPFRVDTPARHRDGEWLAMQAERHGLAGRTIHLRGFHYLLVSTTGLLKPDGSPYRNTEEDWTWLVMHAAKAARWLGYIPFHQIVDARNTEPVIRRANGETPAAHISVGLDITVPDADDLEPYVWVDDFPAVQPFKLVFFGEKTSLDATLAPIAADCGADLYLPTGEISDTMLYQMAAAGAEDGRPMVVVSVADCDPSGWQMPISIARKLQAFKVLLFPDLAFQVRRIALVPDQVRMHGLPSTPLKETERRADRWREAMGVDQTEIDALAALQPALLRRMAREAIKPFFDRTLKERCAKARDEWRQACQQAIDEQTDQERLSLLRVEAERVLETMRAEVERLNRELAIGPDGYALPDPEIPEARVTAKPDGLPLIDSSWSWTEQSRRLIASKGYGEL